MSFKTNHHTLCTSLLIIDDDESTRSIMYEILAHENNVKIALAYNGQDGIEALKRLPHPTLVILDWFMPVMDGKAFIEEVKKLKLESSTQIVVLTASKIELDGYKVYQKPVDINTLLGIYKSHCKGADNE